MKKNLATSLLIVAGLFAATPTMAAQTSTIAVFGDWPYNANLKNNANLLINSVNSDNQVSLVMHVGDIHSGSMPCTGAGLHPLPATSNPTYNQDIYAIFQKFNDPVVYTPGDNEWSDCHKTKEGASGAPLNELAAVRSLFFARPGHTLGLKDKEVRSQAKEYDRAFPSDKKFVENVSWVKSQIVFVTLNMPGSNNDTLPWTNGFENVQAHGQEVAERTAADIRFLKEAFNEAWESNAKGVVIGLQADMWDPAALATGGDGLSAYTPFVQELAYLAAQFGKPVLLINGDSHIYGSDKPLADPTSATGLIHNTQAVPNLTRITVQGSTNNPGEWLRLTVDPNSTDVFSWSNVIYCPNTGSATCQ